jgi:hypothetical protein
LRGIDLSVINPFQPLNKSGIVSNITKDTLQNQRLASHFSGQKTYGLREKVTVNIQSLQKAVKGNFSLSVRKIDALPSKEAPDAVAFLLGETKKDKNTFALNQIPELRGELLSGTITKKNNKTSITRPLRYRLPENRLP